jgi:hypothetical protein
MRKFSICVALFSWGQRASRYDFYSHGPYRGSIPKPSAILGYEAGETHTTFRDQERVFQAIASAAKDRVRLFDYGKSVEGRPLRIAIVSAPENLAKLDSIRSSLDKLADPRILNSEDAEKLIKTLPVVTWINHCIHGDETASFETVMWELYTLAASDAPQIKDALQKSLIVLNPVFNPDGHERFVVYSNSIALGSPENWAFEKDWPWVSVGRFNHYRFDMNRDKLAMSQPETQQESAAILRWHPQVYVDEHGQPEIYFFPPNSQSINRQADRVRLEKWTDIIGRANAAAFDQKGWQYVNRETYDFFYPGYLDTFATLTGAIGMTYETDGGGDLARRRDDGTISTLRDATAHHFEAALATIFTAAKHREGLLRDFYLYRKGAIDDAKTDPMKQLIVLPHSDPGRAAELVTALRFAGIEVREAKAAFSSGKAHRYMSKAGEAAKSQTFPAGALIIDLAQPQGRLARAYLEPNADAEPEFVKEQMERRERNEKKNDNERKEGYGFYDVTAWSPLFTYGLESYWLEDAPQVDARLLHLDAAGKITLQTQTSGVTGDKNPVVYLFPYNRDGAAFLALRLLHEDFRLHAATKPIKASGKEWGRGTIVVRTSRNPETLHARIAALAKECGVQVTALASAYGDDSPYGLGSDAVVNLKKTAVAVVTDDMVSHTSFGALWHLLEKKAGLPFTSIRLSRLRSSELSRFNVVILPEGYGYAGSLGKAGMDNLKDWIRDGGVLIGIGSGGHWFTNKDADMTTAAVVGSDAKPDEKPADAKTDPKPDDKAKPKKPISLPGAIFRATVDPTHFLGYGYDREIAVPLGGATFLKPSTKGSNPVTFGKTDLRLSGFVWEKNTEELLAGTAWVVDEPMGAGHAILYLDDPNFRALWAGLRRMFLNSILFAPNRVPLTNAGQE